MRRRILIVTTVLLVVVAVAAATTQLMAGKPGGNCPKPKPSCSCPDLVAPVVCDGGCGYQNICIARCAGATNCIGIGPGSK